MNNTLHLNKSTQPRQNNRVTKRKLSGHELLLQKLKDEKALVVVVENSGLRHEARILDFDKFTITIHSNEIEELCLFKHAITGFRKVV